MAVNFAKGHGLKFGAIEKYETYKFAPREGVALKTNYEYFLKTGKEGGENKFLRTPGYPLFLGKIYEIFGIFPKIAKQIQLILLIIVASFLPLIGYYHWKKTGLIAGFISSYLFLNQYTPTLPQHLLTEPLLIFTIFLTIIFYQLWRHKKGSVFTSFLFGLILAFSLLVKGIQIFIPPLFFLHTLYLIKTKKVHVRSLLFLIIGFLLLISPWSIYASRQSGKFIFLSTQGSSLLLRTNNELSIDGKHDQTSYSGKTHIFYNKAEIKKLPTPIKIFAFYKQHSYMIPTIFINKIKVGFTPFPYLRVALALISYQLLINIAKRFKKLLLTTPFVASSIYIIFSPSFPIPGHKLINNPNLILLLFTLLIISLTTTKKLPINIPFPIAAMFLNYLLITLIFFGQPRYISVLDFIFMLAAINYTLSTLVLSYKLTISSTSKS